MDSFVMICVNINIWYKFIEYTSSWFYYSVISYWRNSYRPSVLLVKGNYLCSWTFWLTIWIISIYDFFLLFLTCHFRQMEGGGFRFVLEKKFITYQFILYFWQSVCVKINLLYRINIVCYSCERIHNKIKFLNIF